MKNQKWKVGTHPSTVVSDTIIENTNFPSPPNRHHSEEEEIEYYGGYLVCESVGNISLSKLIAAAPELLQALSEAREMLITKGMKEDSVGLIGINNVIKKATK